MRDEELRAEFEELRAAFLRHKKNYSFSVQVIKKFSGILTHQVQQFHIVREALNNNKLPFTAEQAVALRDLDNSLRERVTSAYLALNRLYRELSQDGEDPEESD